MTSTKPKKSKKKATKGSRQPPRVAPAAIDLTSTANAEPSAETVNASAAASNGHSKRTKKVNSLLASGNYRRISRAAKFTPQHVARVLKGEAGTTFESAARIAIAANVTLDELFAFVSAAKRRRSTPKTATKEA